MDATLPETVASAQQSALTASNSTGLSLNQFLVSSGAFASARIGAFGPRLWRPVLVARVPDRTAFQYPLRDAAPFGNLSIGRAHPVDRYRSEPPFLAVAGKTEPAVAVLRSYSASSSCLGPAVSQDALFDQEHSVLDRRAALHFPPLDGRWMHHPDLPKAPSGVEERAVAGVFGNLGLHVRNWRGTTVS